jgi:hypothetical protein
MTRDGTSRTVRRGVVALFAGWMAVFVVIAAVHNHGIPGFSARHATLDQSVAGSLQVASCPACLASHVPVPAPDGPVILTVPVETSRIVPVCRLQHVRSAPIAIRSSRAPPASIDFAA